MFRQAFKAQFSFNSISAIAQCFLHSLFVRSILFVLLFLGISMEAQIIISDPEGLLDETSLDSMYLEAQIVAAGKRNAQVDFQHCNVIFNDNTWHLIPDGHFDVFLWKEGKWINAYRKNDLGYNFHSAKYLHEGKIYSFGGYGFWRLHSDIISFNDKLGEWEISTDYEAVPTGVGIPGQGTINIISGTELSTLNLKTGDINTCTFQVLSQFQFKTPVFTLIGKSYTVFLEENLQLLLDRESNDLFTLNKGLLSKVHMLNKKDCIHVKGDSIFAYSTNLSEVFRESMSADFDQYSPMICENEKAWYSYLPFIGILLLLIGFALGFKKFFTKKSQTTEQVSGDDLQENLGPFDKVRRAAGSTMTQDELDVLFEIPADASPETKRFKRAALITEMNSKSRLLNSKEMIHRIKDPHDKRKYLYFIEP